MILSTFSFVVFLQHFLLHKIQHSIVEYRVRFELTTLLVCNQFPWTTRASVHGPVFFVILIEVDGSSSNQLQHNLVEEGGIEPRPA